MNTYLAYHPVVPWAQLCQLVAYILTVPTLCPTHLVERSTCTLPTQATPVGHVYIKQVGIRWLSGSSICGRPMRARKYFLINNLGGRTSQSRVHSRCRLGETVACDVRLKDRDTVEDTRNR